MSDSWEHHIVCQGQYSGSLDDPPHVIDAQGDATTAVSRQNANSDR